MPNYASFTNPDTERKRKMAELLRAQSLSPIENYGTGAMASPVSPTQGLAKLLQGYQSSKLEQEANTEDQESKRKYQEALSKALSGDMDITALSQSDDPRLLDLATQLKIDDIRAKREQEQKQVSTLTDDEESALGLPTDGIYQRDSFGKMSQVYKPEKVDRSGMVLPDGTINQAYMDAYRKKAEIDKRFSAGQQTPSNVQEWEYYKTLTPDQQEQYLRMKRADKIIDTGSQYVTPSPVDPTQTQVVVDKTLTPDKAPEYIEDIEKRKSDIKKAQESGAAYKAAEYGIGQMKAFQTDAEEVLKHHGLSAGTGFSSYFQIPGVKQLSGAGDFKAKLDTLKTKSFLAALGAMREASKTGGAVGNVSNLEGARFENAYASLDQAQTEEQFKSELEKIIKIAKEAQENIRAAYIHDYGEVEGARMFDDAFSGSQGASDDDLINKYLQVR